MKQFGKVLTVFLIFIFLLARQALAVSVNISDFPVNITDDSFTLTASVSGATNGTNYLRVDVFKDGTTNYFGETFNGSDFYGGSTYSSYLPINIVNATWSGTLQARVGSPTTTQYDSPGYYKLRLRRYTNGGGYTTSEANASAVSINISIPTLTPTPSPAQVQTATTSTPTSTKTPTPTIAIPVTIEASSPSSDILGVSSDSGLLDQAPVFQKDEKPNNDASVLGSNNLGIIMGIGFILSAFGIIAFQRFRRYKNEIRNIE